MEVLTKNQTKRFIKEESEKIETNLFKELNKIRKKILKLEEEIICKKTNRKY